VAGRQRKMERSQKGASGRDTRKERKNLLAGNKKPPICAKEGGEKGDLGEGVERSMKGAVQILQAAFIRALRFVVEEE